jgi:hypothetical protein
MLGTPPYIAPEQITAPGTVDGRADLYALGATAYEARTGCVPFSAATDDELVHQMLHQRPAEPDSIQPDIDPDLNRVIMRLVDKRPEDRIQTADALIASLGRPASAAFSVGDKIMRAAAPASQPAMRAVEHCLACGAPVGDAANCCGCGEAFLVPKTILRFVAGPLQGLRFRFVSGSYYVGRTALLDLDPEISRKHFFVSACGTALTIIDAGSVNGTSVGRMPARTPVAVAEDATITVAGNRGVLTRSA